MSAKGPVRGGARNVVWVMPPKAAQSLAARALKRRESLPRSRRGGLTKAQGRSMGITSGVERAKSIARGELQPAQDIKAFFARFKTTYEDSLMRYAWEDSKVQQVWDLWGGAPMLSVAVEALAKSSTV